MRWIEVAPVAETFFIIAVVALVPYTEIDWRAYIEEVKGFLDGELNYYNLKGCTGPLVYPGGFVWVYSVLYYLTKKGEDIELAQWIYCSVYIMTLTMVLRLYSRAGLTWRAMIPLFISKRIRSLYVLRLFNDCWAMLFLFAAISFIAGYPGGTGKRSRQWFLGCLCYTFAVSIKMNVLLFAPGLLYVMLRTLPLWRVGCCLLLFAAGQVAAGFPFLAYKAYLSKSFEIGRVFDQRWSVNYQFLDADLFTRPEFGQALLVVTAVSWVLLWRMRWAPRTYLTDTEVHLLHPAIADTRRPNTSPGRSATNEEGTEIDAEQEQAMCASTLLTLFESNLVGVIFSRSLHYQFYTWFFYTLPFILASRKCPRLLQVAIMSLIHQGFNSYPPTPRTSMLLQGGFALMFLVLIFFGRDALGASKKSSGSRLGGGRELKLKQAKVSDAALDGKKHVKMRKKTDAPSASNGGEASI
ncbi:hypothetical protein JKF63_00198 [Porcisia hertigi]|uniref:dolichyl-P-Man:Man5GlcNAc2-PP-dolichol alpha-1,3-mannosyltransferase n=1 Tax=Porcisia hertigi TaxID=2761500 RepID=A0A836HCP8_9TRYP|nr:hypothetical protein JKF63_00198 [Porcisia hertigi]